jgi:DNA-binding MarR family transcriptional regulator
VTLILKKLIVKNLIQVVQSVEDKREYQINITEDGLTLLETIAEEFKRSNNIINGLTTSEAFHLNALLDKLREE